MTQTQKKPKSKVWIVLTLATIVILAIAFGIVFREKLNLTKYFVKKTEISTAFRQAVYLTDNKVYFGFISKTDQQFVKLADVYYISINDLNMTNNAAETPKISLTKLGSEMHSPDTTMLINRDQIIFFENLPANSKVNEAINKFISENKN